MKRYVIGDIHGGYLALKQVLDRANFDYQNDKLICLGDVTDGWPDVAESIEELMSIKNLEMCRGNHDDWTLQHLRATLKDPMTDSSIWTQQGGQATVNSYIKHPELLDKHLKFLADAHIYYIDEENRLFLHAGYNTSRDLDDQHQDSSWSSYGGVKSIYFWDRNFWADAQNGFTEGTEKFKEIYIGHTPTLTSQKDGKPVNIANVWNMDGGATYMGKLSLMNIDTKEVFQSDPVFLLYPEHKGRNGVLLAEDEDWNKWGLFHDDPRYCSTDADFRPDGPKYDGKNYK